MWSRGPIEEADPCVAERVEVAHRLLDGHGVVARDVREAEPVDAGVDEDRRQLALGQAAIVAVRRVGLGVEAAGEDDARHAPAGGAGRRSRLGHAARRLGAQDRREALLGEGARDDLAKAGKIGFWSSGRTRPTRRARSPRSFVGRS
jgi:hypothetical protein